jgi:hypothetical protein
LFDHPNGARSAKSIVVSLRAMIDAGLSSYSSSALKSVEQLSLAVWVLFVGAVVSYKLPDQQWFVDGLVSVVDELGIVSWKEMKTCLQGILWLEMWHDGVGEGIWGEIVRKTKDVHILTT